MSNRDWKNDIQRMALLLVVKSQICVKFYPGSRPLNQICLIIKINIIRLVTTFSTSQTNTKPGITIVYQNSYK